MPLPKPGVHLAVILLGGCLFPAAVQADETTSPEERAAPISLAAWVENGEFIGTEQLRRVYAAVGTNQFGFIVPEGFRVDVSRSDRITLTQSDFSYYLTLQVVASSSLANDLLRQQALQHYPGASLMDETILEVAGRRGPMFNLRWKPAEGVDRIVTMAFVPTTAGILELNLVAEQSRFIEAQNALAGLFCRFQSCAGARLRMETFRQPDYN